jgi:hypothetical protein
VDLGSAAFFSHQHQPLVRGRVEVLAFNLEACKQWPVLPMYKKVAP